VNRVSCRLAEHSRRNHAAHYHLSQELARQFDDLIERHGYENRSVAFRDLLRARIEDARKTTVWTALHGVATVTYIYNFHERDLAMRLAALRHDHDDLCVSATHVVLDHANCLETVILRGKYRDVDAFGKVLVAQNGVRHGNVHMVPLHLETPSLGVHQHRIICRGLDYQADTCSGWYGKRRCAHLTSTVTRGLFGSSCTVQSSSANFRFRPKAVIERVRKDEEQRLSNCCCPCICVDRSFAFFLGISLINRIRSHWQPRFLSI
jgi:CopG family nickel-responsive transcriptional regulator